MNKKKLAVLLTTVSLLGVVGIGSTLAYFTDKTDVNNTVTMGNVNISLTEPEFDKLTNGSKKITDVLPGQVIEKDPTTSSCAVCLPPPVAFSAAAATRARDRKKSD